MEREREREGSTYGLAFELRMSFNDKGSWFFEAKKKVEICFFDFFQVRERKEKVFVENEKRLFDCWK